MTKSDRLKKILRRRKEFEKKQTKFTTVDEEKERIKNWTTFYRRNWDIYAIKELGINLKWFQEIVIYLIGISNVFFLMCSRGLSKSFMTALSATIQCMLYPDTEIVITATTIKTAKKFVQKKIENELCGKMSDKLNYLYKKGQIKFSYDQEEVRVSFLFNRSWIMVLPEIDSSLGERITGLICEEARLSKLSIIDRIFIPMRHARVPKYRNNPLYADDKRLVESAKIIYLTSAPHEYEPIWERWKTVVEKTFNQKNRKYNIFIGDSFTSLAHDFMTLEDYEIAKDTSSEIEFRSEYLNEIIKDGTGSFYEYKMFKENATLSNAFLPPTYDEWLFDYKRGTLPYFRKKSEEETRCVYVDFAFVDSVKLEADLSVIGCMSGYPNDSHNAILRNTEYLETFSGGDKYATLLRIRELFFFYEADYLILDIRNGGIDRALDLTVPYNNEELGLVMRGFAPCKDESLTNSFYNVDKLEKFRERVVDKDPMNVMILVAGVDERNDKYHRAMKDALLASKIRFLKDSSTIKREWEDKDILSTLTMEDLPRRILPYIQTDNLVQEAVKLEKRLIKGGYTQLYTTGKNLKDKIVATEYANYLFYLLEMKMEKEKQQSNETDWDGMDFKLVW